jgi:hypothetical protein
MALHKCSDPASLSLGFRCLVALVITVTTLALSGCGGRHPSKGDSRVTNSASTAQPVPSSAEDIRNKTGPFYTERYMPVADRFKVRRERLLTAMGAR